MDSTFIESPDWIRNKHCTMIISAFNIQLDILSIINKLKVIIIE